MQVEYKYPAILYGYLDSWLFYKNLFNARATLLYSLCFSRLIRNEQKDSAEKIPSSMQDACHINLVIDLIQCGVSVALW